MIAKKFDVEQKFTNGFQLEQVILKKGQEVTIERMNEETADATNKVLNEGLCCRSFNPN